MVQALEKKQAVENLNLLGEIEDLLKRTKDILTIAETKKRYGLALNAISEARGVYELLSKIAFSLHAARTEELRLEQLKAGKIDEEEQRQRIEEWNQLIFSRLNESEIDLFLKLLDRINGVSDVPVEPGQYLPSLTDSKPTRHLKRIVSYDEEDDTNEDNEPEPEFRRGKPSKSKQERQELGDLASEDLSTKIQPYSDKPIVPD